VLAIVLGVFAAKIARDAIMKNRGPVVQNGKFVKVIVTKADITPGHALTAEDLTLAQVDAENAPAAAFKESTDVIGRVSETLMVKGQPVVEAMLAPTGSGSGLQALVPNGMRAVTMEVNEFTGVAGLITPGCHVDIVATINEGANGTQIAKTIVQNVKVTAVGQRTAANNEPPQPNEQFRSVTVLASLEDVETIELACATGRPRMVLRGGRDNDIVATAGVTLGELKGSGGKNSDPFVATATTQPAPVATTQPLIEQPNDRRESPRRDEKLIKNGVESNVTLFMPSGDENNNTENTKIDSTDPFEPN
jgi:pilus assembly protein CpaB